MPTSWPSTWRSVLRSPSRRFCGAWSTLATSTGSARRRAGRGASMCRDQGSGRGHACLRREATSRLAASRDSLISVRPRRATWHGHEPVAIGMSRSPTPGPTHPYSHRGGTASESMADSRPELRPPPVRGGRLRFQASTSARSPPNVSPSRQSGPTATGPGGLVAGDRELGLGGVGRGARRESGPVPWSPARPGPSRWPRSPLARPGPGRPRGRPRISRAPATCSGGSRRWRSPPVRG